ncbi:hypothetical protein DXG01_000401, partial [Tephrocybe rancida]
MTMGEVVGYLVDPASTCNKPKDKDLFKYAASAEALQTVIEGSLQAQDLVNGIVQDPPLEEDRLLNDENWGPKTTVTPEESLEGDVEDLVTLGPDIPDDVQPHLVEVLRQNSAAFGAGGHLGQVAAKVSILLQPGVQPISVPMYGASPAKREVIDKQMKAWFEAGVIEL